MKNLAGHLVVWAFLTTILVPMNVLSASLSKELKENPESVTVQPYELYARGDISAASGIYEFINNTTDKAQGISNIDKGRLASNEAFIFNGLSIRYSKDAVNKVGDVAYNSALPNALRNAELEIRQNGRVVLNMPVASFHNKDSGSTEHDNFTFVGSLLYITDDTDFTVSFKFPRGVAMPAGETTNYSYAELRMAGHRTIKK
ncbi:hypothetical protein [Cochleicola gelatinilyticus]|uniref:Uncharacterized protein n=1 Tax=Cochleicola gelatinilyticus TaxID=1763537 RepID=A0A167IKD6_9FLAO|nr:hypothetical protein [Cochleicola gelatinilyticus]OAB79743.1 hypothetical protein ULVI_03080 [Cochleicola gelatinilyticus]